MIMHSTNEYGKFDTNSSFDACSETREVTTFWLDLLDYMSTAHRGVVYYPAKTWLYLVVWHYTSAHGYNFQCGSMLPHLVILLQCGTTLPHSYILQCGTTLPHMVIVIQCGTRLRHLVIVFSVALRSRAYLYYFSVALHSHTWLYYYSVAIRSRTCLLFQQGITLQYMLILVEYLLLTLGLSAASHWDYLSIGVAWYSQLNCKVNKSKILKVRCIFVMEFRCNPACKKLNIIYKIIANLFL